MMIELAVSNSNASCSHQRQDLEVEHYGHAFDARWPGIKRDKVLDGVGSWSENNGADEEYRTE